MKNQNVQRLVVSAVMIALAAVLSMVKIPLPFGGGVTIVSMLPIILIAYIYGTKWGFVTSLVYSVIQMLLGYHTIAKYVLPGEDQMDIVLVILMVVLDYVLAYTAMFLGGVFRKMNATKALVFGSLVATSVRYLCHFVSGYILWGAWAEWFFTDPDAMGNAFGEWVMSVFSGEGLAAFYSLVYNGLYMIPEIILTAVVAAVISKIPAIAKKRD